MVLHLFSKCWIAEVLCCDETALMIEPMDDDDARLRTAPPGPAFHFDELFSKLTELDTVWTAQFVAHGISPLP
jgi:hypothetical protein